MASVRCVVEDELTTEDTEDHRGKRIECGSQINSNRSSQRC